MEKRRRQQAIESVFGKSSLSGDGINCAVKCPVCKDGRAEKKKLVIRLDDGRYQCWVCTTKGNNVAFLAKKHGKKHEILSAVFGKRLKTEQREAEKLVLPPGSRFIGYPTRDPDQKAAVNYLRSRGLTKRDLYRWRIMYSSSSRFRRRVIIPSFDAMGDLNYYIARSIDCEKKPKYLNSKVSKNEIIFNGIDADWSQPIILVEGVFDAIKSLENTIPLLGSTLSKKSKLYYALIKNGTDVTLSLDPDLKEKTFKLANNLSKDGCTVRISFAPDGNDLGQLSKSDVKELVSNAAYYNPMVALKYRIGQIKSGSIL